MDTNVYSLISEYATPYDALNLILTALPRLLRLNDFNQLRVKNQSLESWFLSTIQQAIDDEDFKQVLQLFTEFSKYLPPSIRQRVIQMFIFDIENNLSNYDYVIDTLEDIDWNRLKRSYIYRDELDGLERILHQHLENTLINYVNDNIDNLENTEQVLEYIERLTKNGIVLDNRTFDTRIRRIELADIYNHFDSIRQLYNRRIISEETIRFFIENAITNADSRYDSLKLIKALFSLGININNMSIMDAIESYFIDWKQLARLFIKLGYRITQEDIETALQFGYNEQAAWLEQEMRRQNR